ncbi:hypothetical protein ALC62_05962 [Cyphomyrmex costatus]|uniref:Uncharacterized protein n=1 Tax=Cyphomyrmex costatus TaxID=456900 RepID=A0A151IJA3_9HYME|nr:hypothetical protein ALC62_05962 [Cyphomyrmex costatus]
MTEQFRFYVTVEESTDKKTNVYRLKWLKPVNTELYYELPAELQNLSNHPEISAIQKVKTVLSSIKTRGSYRTFTLSLPPEIVALYIDDDRDAVYKGVYLQATMAPQYEIKTAKKGTEEDRQTTKKEATPEPTSRKNLKKIREDFVLDNFDGKNFVITSWFQMFEKECARCQITSDEDKILILRLFLDGIAKDWFSSKVVTIGLDAEFQTWKKIFLDSFREIGWRKNREAYSFRYIGGSLVDYALRKENLLVNIRNNFPVDILIDLIVTDLPIMIQDRIEKTKTTSMEDLLTELRKLENLVQRRKTFSHVNASKNGTERKPCSYCEKKGFPERFHPEALCRLRQKEQTEQPKNIKTANNVAVQDELNETITDQKN